jgi:hypothetical protein
MSKGEGKKPTQICHKADTGFPGRTLCRSRTESAHSPNKLSRAQMTAKTAVLAGELPDWIGSRYLRAFLAGCE